VCAISQYVESVVVGLLTRWVQYWWVTVHEYRWVNSDERQRSLTMLVEKQPDNRSKNKSNFDAPIHTFFMLSLNLLF